MSDRIRRGLEGVLVAQSELSEIDGDAGALSYRGYPIAELAEQATFEETLSLLWNGSLPTRAERDSFTRELCSPAYRCNGRRPFGTINRVLTRAELADTRSSSRRSRVEPRTRSS